MSKVVGALAILYVAFPLVWLKYTHIWLVLTPIQRVKFIGIWPYLFVAYAWGVIAKQPRAVESSGSARPDTATARRDVVEVEVQS
jgi:hypothetical protein